MTLYYSRRIVNGKTYPRNNEKGYAYCSEQYKENNKWKRKYLGIRKVPKNTHVLIEKLEGENLTKHYASHTKYLKNTRLKLMNILGGQLCKQCNFKDYRTLHFDHLQGKGRKDRKRFSNSNMMTLYYSKHPEEAKRELQVLCANCNMIKRFKNNEYN